MAHYLSRVLGLQCGGCEELEVGVEGQMEETGAMVCVSKGEGINAVDDVINEVEKCGARGRDRELAR